MSSRPVRRGARREADVRVDQRTALLLDVVARGDVVAAEPIDGAPLDATLSVCVAPGVGGISVGNPPMHAAANTGSTTNIAVRMVRGTRMSTLRNGSWSAARLAWRLCAEAS